MRLALRRVIAGAAAVLLAGAPMPANADPTSVSDPASTGLPNATGFFAEGIGARGEPDAKSGIMSYAYEFDLPAARGPVQPRLALTYSSSARDREAGYGWALDLPMVERTPISGNVRPVSMTPGFADERFSFEGRPLVFICEIGGAGCPGGETHPQWGSWSYYRLQVDDLFARFYRSPDGLQWRVQLKGGTRLELGDVDGNGGGIETVAGPGTKVVRWRLRKHVDAVHPENVVEYRWAPLGSRGLLYLMDIFDTKRASGHAGDADFAHHTQLFWEAPGYVQTAYADLLHTTPDRRLKRVGVTSKSWLADGPRQVVRVYHLAYLADRDFGSYVAGVTAPLWHHSFLREIKLDGKCGHVEDENGNVPENTACNATLPPTTFGYEGGNVGFVSANVSTVEGGAADLVSNSRVFQDEEAVAILDLDRDGIPDLVQSWDSGPWCWDGQGFTSVNEDGAILRCHHQHGLTCEGKTDGPHVHPCPATDEMPAETGLPAIAHVGYLNRGTTSAGSKLQLTHQCIDARAPANLNANLPASFLTAQAGASVGGGWSTGLFMWVPDVIPGFEPQPFFARPTSLPSGGCDLTSFDANTFSPAWRWAGTHVLDWARKAGPRPTRVGTNWFTDVDGDGVVDEIVESAASPIGDFRPASVAFSRRYAANEPGGDFHAIQKPFDESNFGEDSLAPREDRPNTKFFYVDVTGDGLVDLVTTNSDAGGVPRVRPGNGRGKFECSTPKNAGVPCEAIPPDEPNSWYDIVVAGAETPWPFTQDAAFHDVTGDGLVDIVKYDPETGAVRVWVNRDGHEFGCAASGGCVAGYVWDDVHGTADVGHHRIAFADMDADGVDDFVVLARGGVFFASIVQRSNEFDIAHAPRPGVLVRIDNGRGATSRIRYRTIQQLDLEARANGEPWTHHSRAVESVVTQVWTQDTSGANGTAISAPYSFFRSVEYSYRDPAYDRWSRAFSGFRKVRARIGGETAVTETTYWFGACQNDRLSREPLPPEEGAEPEPSDVPEIVCPDTSDDEQWKGVTGRPIRVDRFIPAVSGPQGGPAKHLWTKRYSWANAISASYQEPVTGRRVWGPHVAEENTYLFDDALAITEPPPTQPDPWGSDPVEGLPTQSGRKHLRVSTQLDGFGNVVRIHDRGLADEEIDTQTVTVLSMSEETAVPPIAAGLECTADWQCNPTYVTTFGWFAGGSPDSTQVGDHTRRLRYQYSQPGNGGDVNQIEGWLDNSIPLDRHREPHEEQGGVDVAPSLVDHSTGWRLLATLAHDAFGNVTNVARGPTTARPMCTALTYDAPYSQLVQLAQYGTASCTTFGVRKSFVYDRAFGAVTGTSSLALGTYLVGLDEFGRVSGLATPEPDGADPSAVTLAALITYADQSPVSTVDVTRYVSATETIRSVTALNGLGESVLRFDQGDSGGWIVSGWAETNAAGQVLSVRRPGSWSGDPLAYALGAFPPLGIIDHVDAFYDGFGRLYSAVDYAPLPVVELFRHEFHPLSIISQDAEQLRSGGPFAASSSERLFDGHGRVKGTVHHSSLAAFGTETSVDYYPTGEPRQILRGPLSGYERTLSFDTLGRLVMNAEPNTGVTRYEWDEANRLVGTSDARGCGVNLHHDGLGRVLFEDYSPCLAAHAVYTEGDPATGDGFEAAYRYDSYEGGQMASDATFIEVSRFASGNLTAVTDRGGHTRFNYDNRGRVRRMSRQPVKPVSSLDANRIAPHWFESRMDFDIGDRLTRRATGAEGNLLVGGMSEEAYSYNERGKLDRIATSYGALLRYVGYDADGAVNTLRYGDKAGTTVTFARDAGRRVTEHKIERSAPSVWTTASSTYSLPGDDTTPLVPLDLHFLSIDAVGNPQIIEDHAALSVSEAYAPVSKREVTYDDLYRVSSVQYSYATPSGGAAWQSPYAPEIAAGDRRPIPLRTAPSRVQGHWFGYDDLGNTTYATDETYSAFDRSLGVLYVTNGEGGVGPNQLRAAHGIAVSYDASGNLKELKLERGSNYCPDGTASHCAQWFAYDWDELGQLARARRWDFDEVLPSLPADTLPDTTPTWDLSFAYSMGQRVLKTTKDEFGVEAHTLDLLPTLRLVRTTFDEASGEYVRDEARVRPVLAGGAGEVVYDGSLPQPDELAPPWHLFLMMGDHLGSAAVIIDHASSELVERTTYQAYGAIESDFRSDRWGNFRGDYKFTGKEEDIEVGLTYFGARYYAAHLGRWASADPLTIHGLGSDLNPYAYVGGRVMNSVDPFGLDSCTISGSLYSGPCGGDGTGDNGKDEKAYRGMIGDTILKATLRNAVQTARELALGNSVQQGPPPPKMRPGAGPRYGFKPGTLRGFGTGAWNGVPYLYSFGNPVGYLLQMLSLPPSDDPAYPIGKFLPVIGASLAMPLLGGRGFISGGGSIGGGGGAPRILYHYTNAAEGSFARGLWSGSSVTDTASLSATEAVEQLGLKTVPDKIIPIVDRGHFLPNRPFVVQPHPLGPGGGFDFWNPRLVPPSDILPAIPIPGP